MSSLATQLAARTTLDSTRLASAQALKHPPSFIYTPRHAASVTTAQLHTIASNAWDQLAALDPVFERFQVKILGPEARDTDRSALTAAENAKLSTVLHQVLRALGPHMLLKPAGIVLEWLVRRFRVNDLDSAELVALFLPYHTTAHFPSGLALITEAVLAGSIFACLIPARTALAPLQLSSLIALLPPFSALPTARAFLDFVLHLPLAYLEQDEAPPRALVGLWLQVVAGYLDRAGPALPVGERTAVLATVLDVVRLGKSFPDVLVSAYILLARFSVAHPLGPEPLRVVLKALATHRAEKRVADAEVDAAFVTTLVVVCQLGTGELVVPENKLFLGGAGWKGLVGTANLDDLLVQLCNNYNAERFMAPFLSTLVASSPGSAHQLALLQSLLTPRAALDNQTVAVLPDAIVDLAVQALLARLLDSPLAAAGPDEGLVAALRQIYQRWPAVYEAATQARLTAAPADAQRLWVLLSLVTSGAQTINAELLEASTGIFLASSSPDLAVRRLALQQLLAAPDLHVAHPDFVHDTLLARLAEPEIKLATLLLAPEHLGLLHAALSADEILTVIQRQLASPTTPMALVALQLAYLAGAYIDAFPAQADVLVKTIFWSRLWGHKTGGAERLAGWTALDDSLLFDHPWLSSTYIRPRADDSSNGEKSIVIAESILELAPGPRESAFEFLLASVTLVDGALLERDAATTNERAALLLSLTVLRHIIATPTLLPADRLDLIRRTLVACQVEYHGVDSCAPAERVQTTPSEKIDGAEDEKRNQEAVDHISAGAIWNRFRSSVTLRRVRGALLAQCVRSIQTVQASTYAWLAGPQLQAVPYMAEYQALVAQAYRIAHTGTTPGGLQLAHVLLGAIYSLSIPGDTLIFLAAQWTSTSSPVALKLVALVEARAFVNERKATYDFQLVLPAVLVALQDEDRAVRAAAMELILALQETLPPPKTVVYCRGVFYGQLKDGVKYLDLADVKLYLDHLAQSSVELVMDGAYLAIVHSSLAGGAAGDSKKKPSLKSKITTFLVSHITAWSNLACRTLLLRSLHQVTDVSKSVLYVPLLAQAAQGNTKSRDELFAGVPATVADEYCEALLRPYAAATRKYLEASENQALDVFNATLEIPDVAGPGATLRKKALEIVQSGLFAALRGEHKLDLFKRLVRLAALAESRHRENVLACLRAVKSTSEAVTAFFNEVRLSLAGPASKGTKRSRGVNPPARAERLPELVVVLETVDFKTVTVTHGLLLALFDLLSTLIDISSSAEVNVQYAGQLMLATLSKVVENVQPDSGITPDSIRLSPVLDLMRASTNPQTSHQALLLLAQLGPLVPEQLVHNVMPIFTFMGSNVLQRDDAYSLRVVERTLESIVPALVKSMKTSSTSRDALVADLRDLLRVFTDAAAHVPRHRRLKLFVRFVETLGATEFLSAVSMLLLDKNHATDAAALPLAIVESFSVEIQLATLLQYIEQVSRLLRQVPFGGPDAPFLEASASEAATADQSLALISFVSLALSSKQLGAKLDSARATNPADLDPTLAEIVRALLDVSALPEAGAAADVVEALDETLQAAVRLMSTESFSEAVLWLLELADSRVRRSALGLLKLRLPTVKSSQRGDISPAVLAGVTRISHALTTGDDSAELASQLETLDIIVASGWEPEDAALAKTVPSLMSLVTLESGAKVRGLALEIIRKLSNRLGPRLIPLVAKLVPFAVGVLTVEASNPASASPLVASAFAVLEGLFTSVPTFIGAHLDVVFSACLSTPVLAFINTQAGPSAKARASLLTAASKRLPAKTVFAAIIRLHAALDETSKQPMLGLLDVLHRALRQGQTVEIAESYKSIFKLFLTIFDLRRVHSAELSLEDISDIEENALGAFTQFILKLNEQTFRPIFLRTYDWAVIDLADAEATSEQSAQAGQRMVVLFKVVERLLVQLKSIVVPYYSFMLDLTVDLLEQFSTGALRDSALWSAVTCALRRSMEFDENGFWTVLRLAKIGPAVAHQLQSPHPLSSALVTGAYTPLLAQYAATISPHEDVLKTFNTALLMLTRSDTLSTKRSALEAIETLWDTLGDTMLTLVPETTPFLAECLEESDGGVEIVARRVVQRVEDHLGESLDSYLGN